MRVWIAIMILVLAASAARAEDTSDLIKRNEYLRRKLAEAQSVDREKQQRQAASDKFMREGADTSQGFFTGLMAATEKAESYVAYMCNDVNGNYKFGSGDRDNPLFRLMGGIPRELAALASQKFNESHPGSSMDCWQGQGVYVGPDGTQYMFANALINRSVNNRLAGGLTYEATWRGRLLRISDLSGNYISISGSGVPRYIDAKLPIAMPTSVAGKGTSLAGSTDSTELIAALNEVYAALKTEGGRTKSVQSLANDLLLSQSTRETFVARYMQLHAPVASGQVKAGPAAGKID
jgi:hypothetical protein